MIPLKDQFFNIEFYIKLSQVTKMHHPDLDEQLFIQEASHEIEQLELMDRLKLCTNTLHNHLPKKYATSLNIILQIAPQFNGFGAMLFPDFVGTYGLDDVDISLDALKELTKYSSSEFAIRPFLRHHSEKALSKMVEWSTDENEHVRRLSSEGLRPLLPWSFNLSKHLNYPEVSQQILGNLNNDNSLYVRKSVGNHLNDLTKHHSIFVINLINTWDNNQKHTSWIIKKGLRTLIKNGDERVFKFLGYPEPSAITLNNFSLANKAILLGEETEFSFSLYNSAKTTVPLIVDYRVYYVKKSGQSTVKVFKLKETQIGPTGTIDVVKKISFKDLSTRKHYPGTHKIEILVNGVAKGGIELEVKPLPL